ncbi:hypothetical protein GGF43_000427, partial [Coemansia sp. RSA 2618]
MVAKRGKKSSGLDEIGGYKVLPVQFGGDKNATHYLYFRQHQSNKEDILTPNDRTIFMTNLPADTTERDLRRLFHGVARIARVVFHGAVGHDAVKIGATNARMMSDLANAMAEPVGKKGKKGNNNNKEEERLEPVPRTQLLESGSSAHIVLLEAGELASVLSLKAGAIAGWPARDADSANPLDYRGVARYLYEHRAARPPLDLLKAEVDTFMAKFEESQYERDRMLAQQQN